MKRILSSIAISVFSLAGVALWLCSQAQAAIDFNVPLFAREIIEKHGNDITGTPVGVQHVAADWSARRLTLDGLTASNPAGYTSTVALAAGSVTLAMNPDMQPDWHRSSFLPQPLPVQALDVSDVTIHYDIDSEAENLRTLRDKLAAKATLAISLRQAAARDGSEGPLLLAVQDMHIRNIQVEAISREKPGRNKHFRLQDKTLHAPGGGNGITIAELLDNATLALIDDVNREALVQGVIAPEPEPDSQADSGTTDNNGQPRPRVRKRAAAPQAAPAEEQPRESKFHRGVDKAVDGTKNVAKKSWNWISSPFRKD